MHGKFKPKWKRSETPISKNAPRVAPQIHTVHDRSHGHSNGQKQNTSQPSDERSKQNQRTKNCP